MIKISVIITTYNSENTIIRLLDSINKQEGINDLFTIEVIVIDDCSTDNTRSLLNQNNIKFQSTLINSKGPNKGRNIGLNICTGDYFCITDHDDEWRLDRIKKTLPHLENNLIVSSGYTIVDTVNNTRKERNSVNSGDLIHFESNKTFKARLVKSHSGQNVYLGSLFIHQSLKNIHFEEMFGVVDFDWLLKILHKNESVEINESLYMRYVDGANLSLNETYRKQDFYYSLMTLDQYYDEYPREVKKVYRKIHGTRAKYYYLMGDMKKARFFFKKSQINIKTLLFIITSYIGADFVKKKFHFFG